MTASFWAIEASPGGCVARPARSVPIDALIEANATRVNLPAAWIASVVAQESGSRNCKNGRAIKSAAGAIGAMQLMRPTWVEISRRVGLRSSIDDPAANVAAGAAYLRWMYDRFGYPGAFAAYNAGPDRYSQSLSGRPLPRETLVYVSAVLRRIEQAGREQRAAPAGSVSLRLSAAVLVHKDEGRGWSGTARGTMFVLKR